MKEIKKFYIGVFLCVIIFCSGVLGQKVMDFYSSHSGYGEAVFDTDFGNFLAAQHALSINDFNAAAEMAGAIKADNKTVADMRIMTDFFNGRLPKNAETFKDSKDLVHGLIYDAFLIQKDDWKSVYNRHIKDTTVLASPLRIFSGVKQGKIKETLKFIDSLQTNDSWKAFVKGQVAVLNNDIETAAKEFAKVHPDFMNINDYLYLMSFYKKNGMLEDMKILHGDFTARPGGMYVLDYPDIPDWSNYDGYKNNLVFALIQSISHTQIMIYTDLSLLFLRFAQTISNEANMDAINYYLGQYYFHNTGDYKTCFNRIGKTSPFYLFSQLNVAERDADFRGVKKIVHDNPLFVPAIQLLVREYIKNGDKHAALSVLNRALKHEKLPDEGRAFLLKQRAYVYLVFNDAKPAQEDLYDVKIISGNMSADLMALQARAWIVRNRNLDDAYNYAMSLIKNNTSDVYAWTLAAQVVAKKESVDNALEILESVSASGANLSVLYDVLGDLYNAQGEKEKAMRAYNQALDLSDDCMIVVPNVQKKIRKLK